VRLPTLLINGLHDFLSPSEGHALNNRDVIRESNDWLDRYLGPVKR
jgi:hypothetical protein